MAWYNDIFKAMVRGSRNHHKNCTCEYDRSGKFLRILRCAFCKRNVISFETVVAAIKQKRANDGNPTKETRTALDLPVEFTPNDTGETLRIDKAPETMKGKRSMTDTVYLRQWNRANWTGTHPLIQLFSALLIEAARKQGIPLYVHCALRTPQEQLRLFTLNRSKVKGPKAAHTTGCAVDIVHGDDHWELTDAEWQWIGITGKAIAERCKIPIVWGGDWGWDFAHWELDFWRDRDPVSDEVHNAPPLHKTPRVLLRDTRHLLA